MSRPRKDGAPSALPSKCKLTELFIRKTSPRATAYLVWDTHQHGLALRVQPTGQRSWKCIYKKDGRSRWYHIGDAAAIHLAQASEIANDVMHKVAKGEDPCADRKANRSTGTFGEIAERYVDEYAKLNNRSWSQADKLVRKHLFPRWEKLQIRAISRSDVKIAFSAIHAPIVANQTLAAASALFNWAVREEFVAASPCMRVGRNPTKSRERVILDSETSKFWRAFDTAGLTKGTALKLVLLTGHASAICAGVAFFSTAMHFRR